jgi:hypothetical protein
MRFYLVEPVFQANGMLDPRAQVLMYVLSFIVMGERFGVPACGGLGCTSNIDVESGFRAAVLNDQVLQLEMAPERVARTRAKIKWSNFVDGLSYVVLGADNSSNSAET